MPLTSPVSAVLYLGGLRLLIRQWQHFHDVFRQIAPGMPEAARRSYINTFEHILGVAAAEGFPDSVATIGQRTDTTLRQWLARYQVAAGQPHPSIGDFAPDAARLIAAIEQAADRLTPLNRN